MSSQHRSGTGFDQPMLYCEYGSYLADDKYAKSMVIVISIHLESQGVTYRGQSRKMLSVVGWMVS